jgi:transcriptional regulator of acetoin/glycerol metabolism
MIEHENLPSYLFDSVNEMPYSSAASINPAVYNKTSTMQPDNPVSPFDRRKTDRTKFNEIRPVEKLSDETWPAIQRRMILNALLQANGKKNQAARILGMGRSTLWRKIKQYKIEP